MFQSKGKSQMKDKDKKRRRMNVKKFDMKKKCV